MITTGELPDRLLKPADVCKLFGVTDCTLRNWVRSGRFPAPLKIGGDVAGQRRWSPEQIQSVLALRPRSGGVK